MNDLVTLVENDEILSDIVAEEMRLSPEEEQKSRDKLDRCFSAAYKKFLSFLDDPKKVEAYNRHIDSLLKNLPGTVNYYKITPERTALFKKLTIQKEFTTGFREGFNAACVTSMIGKEWSKWEQMEVIIPMGQETVKKKNDKEFQKTIIHEFLHAYLSKDKRLSNLYQLSPEQIIIQNHIEEFCCDASTDIIIPSPKYGDVRHREDMALVKKFNNHISKNNLFASELEVDDVRHEALRMLNEISKSSIVEIETGHDLASKTHPSNKDFILNSNRVADSLAESRTNNYFDNIYGGYVPEHESLMTPARWSELHEQKTDNMTPNIEIIDVNTPDEKTVKKNFKENIISIAQKADDFIDRILVNPHNMKGNIRETYKENQLGVLTGSLISTTAILGNESPQLFLTSFLAGAAIATYCSIKTNILGKKYN
jgi:hypothetical protein